LYFAKEKDNTTTGVIGQHKTKEAHIALACAADKKRERHSRAYTVNKSVTLSFAKEKGPSTELAVLVASTAMRGMSENSS